ncbi:Ig-like domain-containing protein [Actinoplanes sp. ATCC 53533]|uniref:Ig-like domain-containing protein n=1 Tax=Actinoplanes sp. ATCC 53533 TaxID=1288362 RepID=UPI00131541B1|nr:Ig-like domain-containing protein [Actinoplanes sp. ATCC 53533]
MKWRKVLAGLASVVTAALVVQAVTAGPALADKDGSSTSLSLQSGTAFAGALDRDVMTVGVSAGNPSGDFVVGGGGKSLCSGSISGVATCTMTARALPPGTYTLVATYFGNEDTFPSSSGPVPLTVLLQPSTTSMQILDPFGSEVSGDPRLVFGQEQGYSFSAGVRGNVAGTPGGSMTITDTTASGTVTLCSGTLNSIGGLASCPLGASTLPVGTHQITATYFSDGVYVGSETSRTVTVVPVQSTTTTLTLSSPSVPFGSEQTEVLTARVTNAGGGTPTGTVTIRTGSTPICGFTLSGGTGHCSPSASLLRPGSYPLTATYNGDVTNTPSSDISKTLVVDKQPTTTVLTASADVIAFGSEDAELFTVEVVPAVSGTPTGNVTVKNGAVAVCTIILATGNGCFLRPTQLRVGSYQITATYNGDSTYAASTSLAQPVTVVEALIRKNADR